MRQPRVLDLFNSKRVRPWIVVHRPHALPPPNPRRPVQELIRSLIRLIHRKDGSMGRPLCRGQRLPGMPKPNQLAYLSPLEVELAVPQVIIIPSRGTAAVPTVPHSLLRLTLTCG